MPYRSKTVAAWLAVLAGTLGLHRIYLYGSRDALAWAHVPLTAAGAWGAWRMDAFGQDDPLAWVLLPVLGLMIAQAMLFAIVYALTPDDRWRARHHPATAAPASGWGAVLAAVVALLIGGTVLMGTIAYGGQKFFEWRVRAAASAAAG